MSSIVSLGHALGADVVVEGVETESQAEIIAVAEEILGRRIPCLYGGSVNPGNCAELIACPHIDGLFIGRSAWDVAGYLDILARCGAVLDSNAKTEEMT